MYCPFCGVKNPDNSHHCSRCGKPLQAVASEVARAARPRETPCPVWPGWETVRLIGRGSSGAVYEIQRSIAGTVEQAAMKVISIPQNESDIEDLRAEGLDDESITARFSGYREDIIREYSLMSGLKDQENVVRCDDVMFIQHDDGIGWDIFIRMELLQRMDRSLALDAPEEEVVQLGIDICRALIACGEKNILHRDIKPQNIFVSSRGVYKLGDFGIAKAVERTTSGTKTGTYKYMAPEVYNDKPYGPQADIYSLGLVLYWLLNERRTPFLPLPPEVPTVSEEDAARSKRMRGEPFPAPKHGSADLKSIVMKACAFHPRDRFQSAEEMLNLLLPLAEGTWIEPPKPTPPKTKPPKPPKPDTRAGDGKLQKILLIAGLAAVLLIGILVLRVALSDSAGKSKASGVSVETAAEPAALSRRRDGVISFAWDHVVWVNSDGTVGFAGKPFSQNDQVDTWTDIVAVAAGGDFTLGLRADGTVVYTGWHYDWLFELEKWSDLTAIAAGDSFCLGLRSDGTVVTVGGNSYGANNTVATWTDIVAIGANEYCSVGLRADGTVVTCGQADPIDQAEPISTWTDIQAISVGTIGVAGLKKDGTVVNNEGAIFSDSESWTDIQAIALGWTVIAGLRTDGSVVWAGMDSEMGGSLDAVASWDNIAALGVGNYNMLALKADGSILVAGSETYGVQDAAAERWQKGSSAAADAVDDELVRFQLPTGAALSFPANYQNASNLADSNGSSSRFNYDLSFPDYGLSLFLGGWENGSISGDYENIFLESKYYKTDIHSIVGEQYFVAAGSVIDDPDTLFYAVELQDGKTTCRLFFTYPSTWAADAEPIIKRIAESYIGSSSDAPAIQALYLG